MKPFRVLIFTPENLALGGSLKNIQRYALGLNKDFFSVAVVTQKGSGERDVFLKDQGIELHYLNSNLDALPAVIQKMKPDIFHLHRAGISRPGVVSRVAPFKIPILETNIFGIRDSSSENALIDVHLFKSQSSWLKYMTQNKIPHIEWFRKYRVLYNAVELDEIVGYEPTPERKAELRRELGIPADVPVIGRIGRDVEGKFSPILLDMFDDLSRRMPSVRFLMVGLPKNFTRRVEKARWRKQMICLEPLVEPRKLYELYYLSDVFVHASRMGESCGNTISEAMACGKPVVSFSTHWRNQIWLDNSQVEQVEHGVTGFIANTPRAYAAAIEHLLENEALREKMGRAGYTKIKSHFTLDLLSCQLQKIYVQALRAHGRSSEISLALAEQADAVRFDPSDESLLQFAAQYPELLKKSWPTLPGAQRLYALKIRTQEWLAAKFKK